MSGMFEKLKIVFSFLNQEYVQLHVKLNHDNTNRVIIFGVVVRWHNVDAVVLTAPTASSGTGGLMLLAPADVIIAVKRTSCCPFLPRPL